MDQFQTVGYLKCTVKQCISTFGGQKGGSSEPTLTPPPPAYGPAHSDSFRATCTSAPHRLWISTFSHSTHYTSHLLVLTNVAEASKRRNNSQFQRFSQLPTFHSSTYTHEEEGPRAQLVSYPDQQVRSGYGAYNQTAAPHKCEYSAGTVELSN